MSVRFVHVTAEGLAPYVAGLRALEGSIPYPIGDGADFFHIDHGPDYHPFFSGLGEAHFLLAVEGDEVVGTVAGVLRRAWTGARELTSLYIGDLKVARRHRGRGLARRMLVHGLGLLVKDRRLRQARLIYGAAMRGERGDVMRSARGVHPARLARPTARLAVYFAEPASLAALPRNGSPTVPDGPGLDLSPGLSSAPAALISTAGRKDLRLSSTDAPWPLTHLPASPAAWAPNLGAYLGACGAELVSRGAAGPACFALDQRLAEQIAWLDSHGVAPGATCTLYALPLVPLFRTHRWVHLATSEI